MQARLVLALLLLLTGCSDHAASPRNEDPSTAAGAGTGHPRVDFEHWATVFPIETFQDKSGPRQYSTTEPGEPLELWKPRGEIITSPAHLCNIELVRKEYARAKDLGPAVPVDIFLWSVKPAVQPYLTKLGGTPHRESARPWPTDAGGRPYTFVAQFCFVDSRDIVTDKLPADVMLIFFKDADSGYDRDAIHVEWSSIALKSPMTAEQCPAPSFVVPQLSGHIYRTHEYPDSRRVFEQAGQDRCYLFPTTQATKIGREAFYIQGDVRRDGEELLCVLNSVDPSQSKWPFIDLEALPADWDKQDDHFEWGKYRMMFGDVGCLYFVIDQEGRVRWSMDCY